MSTWSIVLEHRLYLPVRSLADTLGARVVSDPACHEFDLVVVPRSPSSDRIAPVGPVCPQGTGLSWPTTIGTETHWAFSTPNSVLATSVGVTLPDDERFYAPRSTFGLPEVVDGDVPTAVFAVAHSAVSDARFHSPFGGRCDGLSTLTDTGGSGVR
jgi:hypothetical protein